MGYDEPPEEVQFVEVDKKLTLVFSMDVASAFHENASVMLQAVTNNFKKADSLYEYIDDRQIYAACKRDLGLSEYHLSLAQLTCPPFKGVKAVGTSGKRSVMVALVLAVALEVDENQLEDLWEVLRTYKLNRSFDDLVRLARDKMPKREPEFLPHVEFDDVEVDMVCDRVPVLSLGKTSSFHESASWFLQSALQSTQKADGLFEYTHDKEIVAACRDLGMSKEEMGIVRVKQRDLQDVKAVGREGKRSNMMALVLALVFQEKIDIDVFMQDLRTYGMDLDKQLLALLKRFRPTSKSKQSGSSGRGSDRKSDKSDNGWSDNWNSSWSKDNRQSGWQDDWDSSKTKSGGSRARSDGNERQRSRSRSGGRPGQKPDVDAKLWELDDNGVIKRGDFDDKALGLLRRVEPEIAIEALEEYEANWRNTGKPVRNPSASLVALISRRQPPPGRPKYKDDHDERGGSEYSKDRRRRGDSRYEDEQGDSGGDRDDEDDQSPGKRKKTSSRRSGSEAFLLRSRDRGK
eukprot:gnl/TRDRNA2_/TRDRNA2_68549_c0_seq1.p1 gnl/TRDRNA2_/TRDRNA2_68549_c0~~gnl/TRDRNA2_/TRDRNA2_68549_c0_seq1.p1  ORF type:complete len:517 (+),score=82.82 gnl/TRDRNA2_/TRDRNA2_68549_c0_seq1:86-1636(+)